MKQLYALLLLALLTSCNQEDDYVYPPVVLEFITVQSNGEGSVNRLITDQGETLTVTENLTEWHLAANESQRMVGYYERNGETAIIYSLSKVIATPPKPASEFEEILTDPADVQSVWLGYRYLNMILLIKAQEEKHSFGFIENSVGELADKCVINLLLYHDSGNDFGAYTKRAYLSIPLEAYYTRYPNKKLEINFSLQTSKGLKSYTLR
jgi:hypothetical protein